MSANFANGGNKPPTLLQSLIDSFKCLPGVGPKSAQRMAFHLLQRNRDGAKRLAETLNKAIKQLNKVSLTFDRLALYNNEKGQSPSTKIPIRTSELLARIRDEFPKSDMDKVAFDHDGFYENAPILMGDIYQLTFCLKSILSYLLRYVPEKKKIGISVNQNEDSSRVAIKIKGFVPERSNDSIKMSLRKGSLSKTIADMALGEEIIEKFVDNHQGSFKKKYSGKYGVNFQIELPIVKEV